MSLTALAIALSIAAAPVIPADALADFRWQKRVVIIFADGDRAAYEQQIRAYYKKIKEFALKK